MSGLISTHSVFRRFLIANAISLLGSSIFEIGLPLYVLKQTHSPMALGIIVAGANLPYFLMAPVTGYLIDHFDSRRLLMWADLGQVACMGLLLFHIPRVGLDLTFLFSILFLSRSFLNLFETVATFQLVPTMVGDSNLSEANQWGLSLHRIVQIAGPLLGGILVGAFGIRICILFNLVSFAGTFCFTYLLKQNLVRPSKVSLRALVSNFTGSVQYIWTSPLFRSFLGFMFFWNLSPLNHGTPSLAYYFSESKHFTPFEYGAVTSFFGLLGVLGLWAAPRLYNAWGFHRTFHAAVWGQAFLAMLALAFLNYPLVFVLIFSLSRVGNSVFALGTFLFRQTEIPKHMVGGVNTALRMFFMLAVPISSYSQGVVINRCGVNVSMVIGSVCLWVMLLFSKKMTHSPEVQTAVTNWSERQVNA